jgi:hypothetical protein
MRREENEREARKPAETEHEENPVPRHPGQPAIEEMMRRYFGSPAPSSKEADAPGAARMNLRPACGDQRSQRRARTLIESKTGRYLLWTEAVAVAYPRSYRLS